VGREGLLHEVAGVVVVEDLDGLADRGQLAGAERLAVLPLLLLLRELLRDLRRKDGQERGHEAKRLTGDYELNFNGGRHELNSNRGQTRSFRRVEVVAGSASVGPARCTSRRSSPAW